jgi:hypothetical protein
VLRVLLLQVRLLLSASACSMCWQLLGQVVLLLLLLLQQPCSLLAGHCCCVRDYLTVCWVIRVQLRGIAVLGVGHALLLSVPCSPGLLGRGLLYCFFLCLAFA